MNLSENLVIEDSGQGLPLTQYIGTVWTNVYLLRIEYFEILFSFHIILTGNLLY